MNKWRERPMRNLNLTTQLRVEYRFFVLSQQAKAEAERERLRLRSPWYETGILSASALVTYMNVMKRLRRCSLTLSLGMQREFLGTISRRSR